MAAKVKEATGGAGISVWYETQPPGDLDKTLELMAPGGRLIFMAGRNASCFANPEYRSRTASLISLMAGSLAQSIDDREWV